MTENSGKRGMVVKNRHDEFFVLPEELLVQYKVKPEKLDQVQAFYESEVEGQCQHGFAGGDKEPWIVGNDSPKAWFKSID